MRVANKVAIVTGGAGGIGSAIAQRLGEQGAGIVLTDINQDGAERVAQRLRTMGIRVVALKHDVTSSENWASIFQDAVAHFGKIDVLVNNAGTAAKTGQPFDAIAFEDWRRVMSVNLDGTFLGISTAVSHMKANGGGVIVNIGSIAGHFGTPGGAAYGTSKGALSALTRQAAFSCAQNGYGIRINTVQPGNVWTDFIKKRSIERFGSEEAAFRELSKTVPIGQMAVPDDVAWAVVYLASDEAKHVTGIDLVVDGGKLCS